jgi:hypothetical protein
LIQCDRRGKMHQIYYAVHIFPSLFQIVTLNIWNDEESFNIVHISNIIWSEKLKDFLKSTWCLVLTPIYFNSYVHCYGLVLLVNATEFPSALCIWKHFFFFWNCKAALWNTDSSQSLNILKNGRLLSWSLVHQSVWRMVFQIAILSVACLFLSVVFRHVEYVIIFHLWSLDWWTLMKSVHTVFLFHSLMSHWLYRDVLLQAMYLGLSISISLPWLGLNTR